MVTYRRYIPVAPVKPRRMIHNRASFGPKIDIFGTLTNDAAPKVPISAKRSKQIKAGSMSVANLTIIPDIENNVDAMTAKMIPRRLCHTDMVSWTECRRRLENVADAWRENDDELREICEVFRFSLTILTIDDDFELSIYSESMNLLLMLTLVKID